MTYHPYLAQGRTAEGYPYAVAALYAIEPTAFPVSEYPFGSYTDGLAIDVRLTQLLRACCGESLAAGASIHVPAASAPCGGIAGDPKEEPGSAEKKIFCLSAGLLGFAIPGLLSVIGDYSEAEMSGLFEQIQSEYANTPLTRSGLQLLLAELQSRRRTALLISDGSGGQQGCAAVITPKEGFHIFLEEC